LSLRLPLALRRGIRSEVPAASRGAGVGRTGRESTRPGTAESTRAGAARARTEPAGTWSGRTLFARPGLADRERPAFERLLVESTDRLLRHRAILVIHESKTARTTGFPVNWKDDLGRYADARQVFPQICLACRIRQIANKQTD